MNQKFSGDIGQVAGRDVQSNNAQSTVSVHIHDGAKTRYITERQRKEIARKAFQIEAKTGVNKLMVYRRLLHVFNFSSMDTLPRDQYSRVTAYLDGWLRNRDIARPPDTPTRPAQTRPELQSGRGAGLIRPNAEKLHESASTQTPSARSALPARKIPWRIVVAAGGVIAVATTAAYIAIGRPQATATASESVANHAPLCEYGGSHYSVGSFVMQAGVRQQCVSNTERIAEWQPINKNRRR
ncbi:alpha/beta hydrolase [Paraburkholderia bonniea]|uniref:alpha/beta hydrolase n=1 Tax=Paraburkholderia bonniea TaxID=2152891 RepID=UPI00129234F5|nr:alpha/beta hydrolase [Paraburkholderia bonniea]